VLRKQARVLIVSASTGRGCDERQSLPGVKVTNRFGLRARRRDGEQGER
jgi:hypothetical protein